MARRKKGLDINGWLIIDKPRGMGSTDVVSITRRMFDANKNGHAGTLDPFATGVLPIAFGEATKLISFVMDGKKEYEFVIKWGVETSTDDDEGEVVFEGGKVPEGAEIKDILSEFLGKIKQTPSKFSAIKIDGKRAYDLARAGEEFVIPEREIEIYKLEYLGDLEGGFSKFRVECSKGTYVRTLGKDIAARLGTTGHLKELRRLKSGVFDLNDAKTLEKLENVEYKEALLPMNACLRDIAVIALGKEDAAKIKMGQRVSPKDYPAELGVAVATFDDELVAVVCVEEERISPVRVFNL